MYSFTILFKLKISFDYVIASWHHFDTNVFFSCYQPVLSKWSCIICNNKYVDKGSRFCLEKHNLVSIYLQCMVWHSSDHTVDDIGILGHKCIKVFTGIYNKNNFVILNYFQPLGDYWKFKQKTQTVFVRFQFTRHLFILCDGKVKNQTIEAINSDICIYSLVFNINSNHHLCLQYSPISYDNKPKFSI